MIMQEVLLTPPAHSLLRNSNEAEQEQYHQASPVTKLQQRFQD